MFNRIRNSSELFLVKWGWIAFLLGILLIWLPFKWLYWIVLIAMIDGIWLLFVLLIRFIGHAMVCFENKQAGRGLMFLILALPGMALFLWSSVAQANSWYVPASWENVAITTFLGYLTLFVIGSRWWYVSGEAMAIEKPRK